MTNELRYSNPRMQAVIENWPSGSRRVVARFEIEQKPGKGERAVRITTGAAKKLTFAKMARIVDGSDGLTYVAELTDYGFISIMKGDMKYQQEAIFAKDPRYGKTLELFAASPNCDGSGPHSGGEVRRLPTGGGGNFILCSRCYNREISYREERNGGLEASAQFSLPRWEELEVYAS